MPSPIVTRVANETEPEAMPHGTVGLRGRNVVLATDGSPPSWAASSIVATLAERLGAIPHVVRALDVSSWPVPDPVPYIVGVADVVLGDQIGQQHAEALRSELAARLGDTRDWTIHVEPGKAARVVTNAAARLDAALIVMGLRRHGALDRLVYDETTLHVTTETQCPVLGVTRDLNRLPRRIVVGMDFGRASRAAARAALDIIEPGGTIVLVHVEPPAVRRGEDTEGNAAVHALGLHAAFKSVAAKLANDLDVNVEPVVLERTSESESVASELRHFAERAEVDVIAIGTQRHNGTRAPVTRDLVRDGRQSVLVVPPHV